MTEMSRSGHQPSDAVEEPATPPVGDAGVSPPERQWWHPPEPLPDIGMHHVFSEVAVTAPDPAARSDAGDGPALGEDARERYGRLVRETWIGWAREQPNPKPSWLVPWEGLSEPDREVDRRIGEALAVQARADGAAEVWSRYARQYEHAEKMPRWDKDKAVVENGWAGDRCGNCGEKLPS